MQPYNGDHERQLQIVARLCAVGGWKLQLTPLRFLPSPEWLLLHGFPEAAWPSAFAVLRLVDKADRRSLEDNLRSCARQGTSFEQVVGTLTFDGRHVFMRLIAEPDMDTDGRVRSIQGACQDVTKIMERERELGQHRTQLEELVEQRTCDLRSFSYALAHDLRAPISAMGGFSQVLAEKLPEDSPPRLHHFAKRIVSNAQRAEALIEGILELITTAQAPLDKRDVDVTAIAWQAVEQLRAREPSRNVDVDVQSQMTARADPRLLVSVIGNLVGNAWKFSAQSQPGRISVGRDRQGRFFVTDNGIGFDLAEAGKLFEPLQRLPSADAYAGTGVGLAAASRIVTRHGGRMWADAKVGQGATFWFTLPD
jgi:signal transduction histidine kinase